MHPVIVPLDGSPRAEAVLPYARAIGGGAPLLLVSTPWGSDALGPGEYLEQTAAKLTDVEVETTVIYDRPPVDAILLVAEQHPGSMICMATHGRGGIGEAMLGSVAESVVRGAEIPVLLVGPHADAAPSPTSGVLLAVDDERTAASITPAAAELAATLGVPITVLEVIAPPPLPLGPEGDRVESPGEGSGLEAAVAALAQLGQDAQRQLPQDIDPAGAIVDFARRLPASVVVVGTHARRGLARVVLGSVAMKVVHRSPCAVLVVRS